MDQYGTCELDDGPMLAEKLKAGQPVIFSFSLDKETGYVISITPNMEQVGTMSFGGDPDGRYGVGLLYRGFAHLRMDPGKPMHASYVGEKLGLNDYDADAVTQMLNAIREELG